jgi:hypothetical protein
MTTFRPSYAGIGQMLRSADMEKAMLQLATHVMARCEETAPVDELGPHPGRYKAAFRVSSGVQHRRTARAYGRVTNDAPEARFVEYGTKNNPRHRTMGAALDVVRTSHDAARYR